MRLDWALIKRNPKLATANYLIHSYLYYVHDNPIIEDSEYDALCKFVVNNFDKCQQHVHGSYLDLDAVKAGSAYHIKPNEYPLRVRSAAERLNPKIKILTEIDYVYDEGWARQKSGTVYQFFG